MKRITAVDRLEAGQVLGADAMGPDGACIALTGAVLDADGIARLRAASMSTVMVELSEDDVRALVSDQPEDADAAARFRLNDLTHPVINKLVEVASELRA
ncbi:MAG: hypothetical protein AAF460_11775 [Pseudomonadota bacterium]